MVKQRIRTAGVILLLSCALLAVGSGPALAEIRSLELLSGDVYTYVSTEAPLRRVVVGNPDIINVDVASKYEIILVGKKLGNTKVLLRDDAGGSTTLDIMVSPDITTLKKRISPVHGHGNLWKINLCLGISFGVRPWPGCCHYSIKTDISNLIILDLMDMTIHNRDIIKWPKDCLNLFSILCPKIPAFVNFLDG